MLFVCHDRASMSSRQIKKMACMPSSTSDGCKRVFLVLFGVGKREKKGLKGGIRDSLP
jgi:hypothetical protein